MREYDVNIFFIQRGDTLVAIDAGYKDYPGFAEACAVQGIDPKKVQAVFLTHADPDHAGGLDARCENIFPNARVYLGKTEENYLTNVYHRKQIGPFGLKNSVSLRKGYRLLEDGETVRMGEFELTALLVPGHTLGHLAYLLEGGLLFTGDSIALNADGGWCFFDLFNYDSELNSRSLAALRDRIDLDAVRYVFTAHNGFTDDSKAAFRHVDVSPDLGKKGFVFDETAPYDCFAG